MNYLDLSQNIAKVVGADAHRFMIFDFILSDRRYSFD